MTTPTTRLKKGDRIVHQRHGVGQIMGVDTRNISGEPTEYYRFQTADSLVWLAVEEISDAPIRPVSTESAFDSATNIIKLDAVIMSDDKNIRSKQIQEIKNCNDPELIAEMMRDLYARDQLDPLLYEEKQSLKGFITRFATEWSVSKQVTVPTARDQLMKVLADRHKPKPDA